MVIIDAGSTPRLVATMLPDSPGLTVVTNSVPAAVAQTDIKEVLA